VATFTPPTVFDNPAILPDSGGLANRLFRYFPNRARYVAVFALSDGTFAQDTPTAENSNTNIPYPYDPYAPSQPYSVSYYTDYSQTPPEPTNSSVAHSVWITKVYLGAQYVTPTEAAALTAAGYGDLIS
jgi:hypothetical protein